MESGWGLTIEVECGGLRHRVVGASQRLASNALGRRVHGSKYTADHGD